jgi:hypothetical protein
MFLPGARQKIFITVDANHRSLRPHRRRDPHGDGSSTEADIQDGETWPQQRRQVTMVVLKRPAIEDSRIGLMLLHRL